MRSACWLAAAALTMSTGGSAWALDDGLVPSVASLGPQWQGRLALGTYSPIAYPDAMNIDSQGLKISGASLLGDFYFSRTLIGVGSASGFRATSGLFIGTRNASLLLGTPSAGLGGRPFNMDRRTVDVWGMSNTADSNGDQAPVPYVGLGYTRLARRDGWGFSADLGVMALKPGSAVKLGNGASLDDALRDMRLSPLLQLGVTYSF